MYLFIESFTIMLVLNFGSFSSADINPTCDWFSEEAMASLEINNSTMQEFGSETRKLEEYPRLRRLDLYRNCFPSSVEAESQLLERAIFEYIRDENVLRDVIMLHNADSDDGLLLSELLYSNSVQVIHIEVQVVCEALKILEQYFSTLGSSNLANILLISLEDREEIDQLLMTMISSKGVKALVVGGLQKWQDRLLEVKAYEIHLIMVTHYKESEQPVDSFPTKEDNSIYGSKGEDVYIVWKSVLADEGSQKLRQVAVWTNGSGLINMVPDVDTITVRVALVEYPPFMHLRIVNGTVTLGDCILKKLLKEFTERLNLKFKLIYGYKWGSKVDTGWTGSIGMVLRGEADMIPYLPVTESRQNVLDFTKPKAFVWHGILVAYPGESSGVFVFFRLYQKEVWISLIMSTIALSYILSKILNFRTDSQKHTSFFQCFWYIYGFLFQQGATRLPSLDSARILLVTCWLSTFVITATFTGNLFAFFASSQNEYIVKSLKELANHESVSLAIREDSPVFEKIKESQVALYQRIQEVFLRDDHRLKIINFTNRVDDGILNDVILDDVAAGNTIYIDDSHQLARLLQLNENTCRIAIAPDRFVAKELAFGLRKGSSLLQPLNEQIQKMMESGIFSATEKKFTLSAEACTLGPTGQRRVKIHDLLEPFCILLLASLFGFLILGIEIIGDQVKRNIRTQDAR